MYSHRTMVDMRGHIYKAKSDWLRINKAKADWLRINTVHTYVYINTYILYIAVVRVALTFGRPRRKNINTNSLIICADWSVDAPQYRYGKCAVCFMLSDFSSGGLTMLNVDL